VGQTIRPVDTNTATWVAGMVGGLLGAAGAFGAAELQRRSDRAQQREAAQSRAIVALWSAANEMEVAVGWVKAMEHRLLPPQITAAFSPSVEEALRDPIFWGARRDLAQVSARVDSAWTDAYASVHDDELRRSAEQVWKEARRFARQVTAKSPDAKRLREALTDLRERAGAAGARDLVAPAASDLQGEAEDSPSSP
jgi:hypothetical protein